ncbi:MAG: NCS1 family nucleobase:cation symporter-1 [Deltaproteobacteria bacterium]|nr:NCS1 family nucleobase:cation symporter-1 [Deltaproteobacteria bacterium]
MSDADNDLSNEDLAPTTPERRTWNLWHIAALWVGMAVCIPTYTLASGLVDKGWSWQAAVGSVALGNFVVLIPMVLNAHAGTRYGIPFPVLVRSSFGTRGANLPALLRAFVACGWFGINTYIGGAALAQMVRVIFMDGTGGTERLPFLGISGLELLCFLAFWALQISILLKGIDSIKVLETFAAPFLLLIGVALLAWAVDATGSFSRLLENPSSSAVLAKDGVVVAGVGVIGIGLTTAVSFWGTLALNIPDFSRFARTQRDQIIGQALGLPATMAFFAFIGAVVTNATFLVFGARISDPVQLLGRIGGPMTTIIAMLALLIATLTTNVAANIVGPANDFSNVNPKKISFKMGCVITAIIGLIIMPWRLYNDAASYLFTWLLGYGAMLGSVGGVMIADYYFIQKRELDVDQLYKKDGKYKYMNGWNPVAVVALFAGILPNVPGFLAAFFSAPLSITIGESVFTIGPVVVGEPWTTIYEWAWFVAFFISAIVHLAGTRLMRR